MPFSLNNSKEGFGKHVKGGWWDDYNGYTEYTSGGSGEFDI